MYRLLKIKANIHGNEKDFLHKEYVKNIRSCTPAAKAAVKQRNAVWLAAAGNAPKSLCLMLWCCVWLLAVAKCCVAPLPSPNCYATSEQPPHTI